jgi:rhodanese-related sulfurtransferase
MSKKHKPTHASSRKPSNFKNRRAQKVAPVWVWIVLAAIIVGGGVYWLSTSRSLSANNTSSVGGITTAQAYEKIQQGAFILDVRTQAEYEQAHIANSTLIPLTELADRVNELPRDREIVVVCRTGSRSKQALSVLKQAGIPNAFSMTGGINAWKEADYPLESTAP